MLSAACVIQTMKLQLAAVKGRVIRGRGGAALRAGLL